MLAFLLVAPMISAQDLGIDNVKDYNPETKELSISDTLLWLWQKEELARIRLITEHDFRVIDRGPGIKQRVWEVELINFDRTYTNALKDMEFFNIDKDMNKFDRDFEYRYKNIIGTKQVPIHAQSCSNKLEVNGTISTNCESWITGYEEADVWGDWRVFSDTSELPAGKIRIAGFTDVLNNEQVEWIPTWFGVEIDEWATWNSTKDSDLLAYYYFNEPAATGNAEDSVAGNYNMDFIGDEVTQGKNTDVLPLGVGVHEDHGGYDGVINSTVEHNLLAGTAGTVIIIGQPDFNTTTGGGTPHSGWSGVLSAIRGGKEMYGSIRGMGFKLRNATDEITISSANPGSNWTVGAKMLFAWVWDTTGVGNYSFIINDTVEYNKNLSESIGPVNGSLGFQLFTTVDSAGGISQQYPAKGNWSEVMVWNRSLSYDEIQDIYNSGLYGFNYTGGGYPPTVNITYPLNTSYYPAPTALNYTVINTDAGYPIQRCWYSTNGGTTNSSHVAGGTNFTGVTGAGIGSNTWIVYCNNSGFESSDSQTFNVKAFVENSQTYSTNTVEGSIEEFRINFNYTSSDWSLISAFLNYNHSKFDGITSDSGDTVEFYTNITIPSTASDVNKGFNWTLGFTNTTDTYYYNSSSNTQSIYVINMSLCGTIYNVSYVNFTIWESDDNAPINGSMEVTFNYKAEGGATQKTFSFSNTSNTVSDFDFCFDPANFNYSIDTILQYSAPGYVSKFYNLEDKLLTNKSEEIKLYVLNESDSTSFIIELRDYEYNIVTNAKIYVQEYIEGDGEWVTTEIVTTNDDGEAIAHILTEDALYRFKVYVDNVLEHTTSGTPITCPEVPCTVLIVMDEDYVGAIEANKKLGNLVSTLTYNSATHLVRYTYADTSGNFTQSRLIVIRYNIGSGNIYTPICNTTKTTSSGVIQCDISNQVNGTYVARGYIKRDAGEVLDLRILIDKFIDIVGTIGLDGVLISIFLFMGIVMLGVLRPSLGIIFAIVGIVGLRLLGLMEITMTAIVSVIAIGVILLWEINKQ